MRVIMCRFTLLTAVILALSAPSAQPATLDELATMGEEALKRGNYTEAIRHYEEIVETGQTYVSLLAVKFDLAWCYYLTSQPEKAIPLFESLSGKRSPNEEVRQQSLFLLAECKARLAATEPEASAERKKAATQSVELHTKFQKDYPKNPNVTQSFYGRAYAHYLCKEMEKAEADLKEAISRQPGSQTARDATFLLATVYSAQGLAKLQAGEKDESKKLIAQARDLFTSLAKGQGTNLATANDSVFSLAETWFAAGEYFEAIRQYQQLRSKAEVARSVQRLQELAEQQLKDELKKEQDTRVSKAAIDKLRAQVRDISRGPEIMISGYFRIADAFYRLERYDEMRTVCRHLLQFAETKEQQQAQYLIINSYLQEENADSAAEELEDFQDMFGYDVDMVDTVALSIGQIYLAKDQLEKAQEFFKKSEAESPEGRRAEESMFLMFAAEYMDKKYEQTIESATAYMDKFPKGKYVANAMYFKAVAYAAQRQWDAALAAINAVVERFPKGTEEFTSVDEAFYQKGWVLNELKKHEEAARHLESFLDKFKDSKLRPEGMYQLGIALNAEEKVAESESILRSMAEQYPDNPIAPLALYQIAVQCFDRQDYEGMEGAIEYLLKQYPENQVLAESHFWLGWIARQAERFDEALEQLETSININPTHELAPEAKSMRAQIFKGQAERMGSPVVLTEEQRAEFKQLLLQAAAEFEDLMLKYPDSRQALSGVPSIVDCLSDLVRHSQFTKFDKAQALDYFANAARRHSGNSNMGALFAFSKGSFLMRNREKEGALESFKESLAMKPDVKLSPTMLAEYAEALKDTNSLAEAEKIFRKIIADYPDDPTVLAPAWYGIADIKYREGDFEEAKDLFQKVLSEYDWYEQGRQGRVMLARIFEQKGQFAEAEKMFEEVWKQEKGEPRLGAMLGVARCQLAQAEAAKKVGDLSSWQKNEKAFNKNLSIIIAMFEAYPEYVAEALWLKGNGFELSNDKDNARKAYSRLVLDDKYKTITPWAELAAERLKKLGGVLAPDEP